MEILHYEEMARDLKIGTEPRQVNWRQIFACTDALAILCSAYHIAVKQQIKPTDNDFSPKEVFLVREERLSAILAECTALPIQFVRDKTLCFNVGARSLEVWDTPLIRLSNEILLVTPALVTTGDPIRTLENLASQWNGMLFTDRGPLLEREALAFLAALDDVVATGPVTISSLSRGVCKFDVVVRWEDQIFLIEAKYMKMVFGPSDLHRAKTRIDEAVDQLIVRKCVLLNEWRKMKIASRTCAWKMIQSPLIASQRLPSPMSPILLGRSLATFSSWMSLRSSGTSTRSVSTQWQAGGRLAKLSAQVGSSPHTARFPRLPG